MAKEPVKAAAPPTAPPPPAPPPPPKPPQPPAPPPPPGSAGVTTSGTTPVDGSHKKMLESYAGKELTADEWGSIRQCLRCLLQGLRLSGKDDGPRTIKPVVGEDKNKPATTNDAVAMVIDTAKKGNMDVLKAARKLAFADG